MKKVRRLGCSFLNSQGATQASYDPYSLYPRALLPYFPTFQVLYTGGTHWIAWYIGMVFFF
ncbi:hypothetical protein BJX68DRAFT_249965 [Aspergillus pseudodeflectus]|uniref:Uncharacterized protein n=1 Tax=Aspergillus pseudodeflectus TaxID=176178 RepID=A0ABR4JAY0_9EURO